MPSCKPGYNRILLKLSGESLAGDAKFGVDPVIVNHFAEEIKSVVELGIEIGIVIGGGNFFRGLSDNAKEMDRVTADHIGMLATVMNSLIISDALIRIGIESKVMTANAMTDFAEPFVQNNAIEYLKQKKVVVFGSGTGNPYFTTDTAAVLKAVEVKADVVLKGTRVDGVYNADPEKVEDAFKFDTLTYLDVIKKGLQVMDMTAITLSMDNELPIIVFNFNESGNLRKVVSGENIGTKVEG
jgi:uridylate kinase